MPKNAKRRRMVKFRLDEISLVDRPAQIGARALIMKRDDADDPPDPALRKLGLLTSEEDGHAHLIVTDVVLDGGRKVVALHGETSIADGHAHPWLWTGDGIVVGHANGHDHTVAAVGASVELMHEEARERARRAIESSVQDEDERVPDAEAAEKLEKERAEMLTQDVRKCGDMVRGFDELLSDAARAFAKKGEDFYDAYHRLALEQSPEGDAFRKTIAHRDDAQRLAAEKVGATYRSGSPANGGGAVAKCGQFAKVADVDAALDAAARRRALPGEAHLDAYCRLMDETSPGGDEFRGLIAKRDEVYRRAVG